MFLTASGRTDTRKEQTVGKISVANMKKTAYYLKRNGLYNTWYAVRERLAQRENYVYEAPAEETLAQQRQQSLALLSEKACGEDAPESARAGRKAVTFSIVVPAYRTNPEYLKDLVDSVTAQSYPGWELILADATEDDSVGRCVETIKETAGEAGDKIQYVRLEQNAGISGNTNAAMAYAKMEYIGLLDHDDVLTPDALFEMAQMIQKSRDRGVDPQFLYSDEDKCDGDCTTFYEPNRKEKFNYDLLLSNNYICHFLVMKRQLMQKLMLRPEYDGAQDYDLVLRAVEELGILADPSRTQQIRHVSRVLYHWRCHTGSTAENPQSKVYAYEAGRRALQDHLDRSGIRGEVRPSKHVGFYEVRYPGGALACRQDLGAVGNAVVEKGRIVGGRMHSSGKVFYENLPVHYSGYMHRAAMTQDADAVDIRNIRLRRELWDLFREVTGTPYCCMPGELTFDITTLPEDTDWKQVSLELGSAIRKRGYRILWKREDGKKNE